MDLNAPPPDDAQLQRALVELIAQAEQAQLEFRRQAIEQLYELAYKVGSKAAPAIPTLLGGLADPDPKIGESALWALNYCAPDSIQPLMACLSHPAAFVRERAAHALGNVGDEARAAAPSLQELLRDPDQAVRRRGAWALGLLHDSRPETIALLARMVSHGTPEDGSAALHALGNIGKRAQDPPALAPYRTLILAALDSADKEVRRCALYAAESTGLDAQTCAELMVSVVQRDASSEVRSAALSMLKTLAPMVQLDAAVAILTSRLAEPPTEAASVCAVLGSMRPVPTTAIPSLRAALDRDELVLPAAAALWRIEGRPESILPALQRAFDDNGEGVCDLLCELGPAALPLVPDLLRALSEDNWDLQWAAADALCAIASSDPVVLAPLLDALAHPSPIVRSASARALAAAGAGAVDALRALVADAADPRAAWAAYALGEMGSAAAQALPELREGMREEETPLAACCAIAVALIATDAGAVPYLVAALQSEDARSPRHAAAAALGQLGPAASDAVGALEGLLDDQDSALAEAALEALAAIQGLSH